MGSKKQQQRGGKKIDCPRFVRDGRGGREWRGKDKATERESGYLEGLRTGSRRRGKAEVQERGGG